MQKEELIRQFNQLGIEDMAAIERVKRRFYQFGIYTAKRANDKALG